MADVGCQMSDVRASGGRGADLLYVHLTSDMAHLTSRLHPTPDFRHLIFPGGVL